MTQLVSKPYEKVRLSPPDSIKSSQVVQVLRTAKIEILHVVVRVGEAIPTHEPQGDVILHCLAGCVELRANEVSHKLAAGEILLLRSNEPVSIKAGELSSLLMTILEPQTGGAISLIGQKPDPAK